MVEERGPNNSASGAEEGQPRENPLGGAEEQFRLLMECVIDHAIFLLDPQGRVATFEVARRLREQPGTRNPLLLALTGWAQEEDRQRCYEAGFDGHLPKPLDLDALHQFLNHPKLIQQPGSAS